MLQEETRADIQPAAGKNVGVVMDGPRRAVQLPAVGLRRIGKLRSGENAVDQTRFFPRQRGGGGAEDFFKQRQRRVVHITGFRRGDDAGFRRDYFAQGAQLLFQQRQLFWHLNQHQRRRGRQRAQAILKAHALFIDTVHPQVVAGRQLGNKGVVDTDRVALRQRAGERAEAVVEDERQAVDVIHLLQQIFIRRFPCLKRFFFSVRWEPL